MSKFRIDIQALRGIAISLVVLDHFAIGPFRQGFLGVDIFFVISGFLICGIITREIDAGTFSFARFYARRAKRILPAAYVTILLTSVTSIWFLDSIEMRSLTSQVAGALTYTINFVLWKQIGYFDVSANLKPLLHMWSLAIEEQFYILFPIFLVILPRAWRLRAVAAIAVVSFGLGIAIASKSPATAFYMLPTRAWELMIGSIAALSNWHPAWMKRLFWPALATLVALSIVGTGTPHPGIDAGIVCVATAIIILSENKWASESLPSRSMARIGDISYSLYLVHWPIAVFLYNACGANESIPERLAGLALTLLLSVLLYALVEQPLRRVAFGRVALVASVVLCGVFVGAVQVGAQSYASGGIDFAYLKRPNYGLDRACDHDKFESKPPCRTSDEASTLVWGDSYAMFVASGAQYHLEGGMVQATYSACPPFIGYAPFNPAQDEAEAVSKSCIAFNDQVETYALSAPQITTVVLAASFWQYTVPGYKMMRRDGGSTRLVPSSLSDAQQVFSVLVKTIEDHGKKVIVVAPPPAAGPGNLECAERRLAGLLTFSGNRHCETSAALYRQNSSTIESLLDAARNSGAQIVRISDALCDEKACHTLIDGTLIYRDEGHLSYGGAKKVFAILANMQRLPPPFN
jgi:peptidoglycan/LPS O-acetylase OafA/YrhL